MMPQGCCRWNTHQTRSSGSPSSEKLGQRALIAVFDCWGERCWCWCWCCGEGAAVAGAVSDGTMFLVAVAAVVVIGCDASGRSCVCSCCCCCCSVFVTSLLTARKSRTNEEEIRYQLSWRSACSCCCLEFGGRPSEGVLETVVLSLERLSEKLSL